MIAAETEIPISHNAARAKRDLPKRSTFFSPPQRIKEKCCVISLKQIEGAGAEIA
jgi:hypothetical protein